MKRLMTILLLVCMLTACSNKIIQKSPHEILLSIKDYSCKINISYISNKNTTNYTATQTYSSLGQYSMEFLDSENLKINYENSILSVTSKLFEKNLEMQNYKDLNQNPLFLSYFIKTYFNLEDTSETKITKNSIQIKMPEYNPYLYFAKLTFKNNKPYSLTYLDENGNDKVNIIYNEFTFI